MLTSCSKSSSPTSSNNNTTIDTTNKTGLDSATAVINGKSDLFWSTYGQNIAITEGNLLQITANDTLDGRIVLSLTNITKPGVYDVGIFVIGTTYYGVEMSCTFVYPPYPNGSYRSPQASTVSVGKLTVQEITATSIKAIFNATLTKYVNGSIPDSVVITNGSLNATIH